MSKVIFKFLDIMLLEESKMNYFINRNARSIFQKMVIAHKIVQSIRSSIVRGDSELFTLLVERCQCSMNQRSPTKFFTNFNSNRFLNLEKFPTMQLVNNLELKRLKCCLPPEVYLNKQKKKNILNF